LQGPSRLRVPAPIVLGNWPSRLSDNCSNRPGPANWKALRSVVSPCGLVSSGRLVPDPPTLPTTAVKNRLFMTNNKH